MIIKRNTWNNKFFLNQIPAIIITFCPYFILKRFFIYYRFGWNHNKALITFLALLNLDKIGLLIKTSYYCKLPLFLWFFDLMFFEQSFSLSLTMLLLFNRSNKVIFKSYKFYWYVKLGYISCLEDIILLNFRWLSTWPANC